ncbi:MAG: hypothetical protein R2752_01220 [Vicinamibacterales bacterium]
MAASAIDTPNLLARRPVEMCGWLSASMSVHAHRDAGGRAARAGQRGQAVRPAGRLDVDRADAQRHGAVQLTARLAHAGTPISGVKPARSATRISPPELASADAPVARRRRTTARVEFAFSA